MKEFGKRTGLKVDFAHAGIDQRLAPGLEACLYRIIQEATHNVARHARACACRVTMQRNDGRLSVIVEDDGRGFEAANTQTPGVPRGLGLVNIRERVAGFGVAPLHGGPEPPAEKGNAVDHRACPALPPEAETRHTLSRSRNRS